jgi:TetR/AcrR family transcriptional repressor of nem operon
VPWPEKHKEQTRERIVQAAAEAFRARGVEGVSVADVMRKAGLTHGGFYAHFASKEELLAAAMTYASAQTEGMLSAAAPGGASPNPLLAEAYAYLSMAHRDHPEKGCPIAALAPELLRASPRVRRTIASEVSKRIARLRDALAPRNKRERDRDAAGAAACMVGGMILSRAMDEGQAAAFLESCRAFLREALS